MSQWFRTVLSLWLVLTLRGSAEALAPGDTIRLTQRGHNIPAHPVPGDNNVPLRFLSNSTATVLRIDASTGWVEIRGTRGQGGQATGWITTRYIASTVSGSDTGSGSATADSALEEGAGDGSKRSEAHILIARGGSSGIALRRPRATRAWSAIAQWEGAA